MAADCEGSRLSNESQKCHINERGHQRWCSLGSLGYICGESNKDSVCIMTARQIIYKTGVRVRGQCLNFSPNCKAAHRWMLS